MITLSTELSREDKEKLVEIFAEKARRKFIDYCYFTDRNYKSPKHLGFLCSKLDQVERGEILRLMIFMPPRHGKSQTTSRKFPAYYLGKHPDDHVIMTSYSDNLTRGFSRTVRDTIESRTYQIVFPICTRNDVRSVSDWLIADHEGGLISAGVGGSITGHGAHLFIIDDPIKNQEEAESEVYREKVWEWYRSVVLTRLEPGARLILIMTRWHGDDLAGRIMENEKGDWEIINFPALYDEEIAKEDIDNILNRQISEALWENRYSAKELLKKKDKVGSRVWWSLYQGKPRDPKGKLIQREWIRYYDELPIGEKWRFGGIDTATSKQTVACNMSMVDVVRNYEGFLHVDDVFLGKISVTGFAKSVSNWHSCRGYTKINLEDNNAGEAVKQRCDEVGQDDKTYPPIHAVTADTDKVVRVVKFQHLIENGTIRFKRGNPRVEQLIDHLVDFPQGPIDDDVDALGHAITAARNDDDGGVLSETEDFHVGVLNE